MLVSAGFSQELTSTVLWLRDHQLDIRCVRLQPCTYGPDIILDVQQIIPLPEANDYFVKIREKEAEERTQRSNFWSGFWYVNVGMDNPAHKPVDESGRCYPRHWQHCAKFGYLAAGGGLRYSDPLKKLKPGDQLFAYQAGKGYVGYGIVIASARPIHLFELSDGRTLAEALNQQGYNDGRDENNWEYAVSIKWGKIFDLSEPQTFTGAFSSQWVACKLSDPETVRFLKQKFQQGDVAQSESAILD